MIPKTKTLRPPWDKDRIADEQVIALELMLGNLHKEAIRYRVSTYIGDGVNNRSITIGFAPILIYIQRWLDKNKDTFPFSGNACFAFKDNDGVAYIPGTGFVKNAILSYNNNGVVLGTNVAVNEATKKFLYFALG